MRGAEEPAFGLIGLSRSACEEEFDWGMLCSGMVAGPRQPPSPQPSPSREREKDRVSQGLRPLDRRGLRKRYDRKTLTPTLSHGERGKDRPWTR